MNEIIKSIVTFSIGSGILAFLIRSIVVHFLDKDTAKYREDIKRIAEEHVFRFQKLHIERADVIKNLYRHLDAAIVAMQSLISPIQLAGENEQEKRKTAIEKVNKFIAYYSGNRIFFPERICKLLDTVIDGMKNAYVAFNHKERRLSEAEQNAESDDEKLYDNWDRAWKSISKDIPAVKSSLETEFRKILGVDDTPD